MSLMLTLSASFPHLGSTTSAPLHRRIPRTTAYNIIAASVSPLQLESSVEEKRGRIAKVFDRKKKQNELVSISAYDTAWVAMVPSPFSSEEPCFPDSVFWLLENQCTDGSWARPHHHSRSLLKKDLLSSTLACILALHKWGVGREHIQKGLQFIEQNIGWARDDTQITPVGFNIVFPALLDYATDSSLNLRLEPSTLNHLMKQRDLELQRCDDDDELTDEAYLAYIGEGMGKSHNWESSIKKYQRKNGSLFNSPSTTAAAYIALRNSDCLRYLNSAFTTFGSAALPAVYPLDIYYHLCIVDNLQRLGISRFFPREIQTVLNRTYKCWVRGDEEIFMDAITCALAFRILRLNGYSVTSEAITNIVSEGFSSSFPGNMRDINTTLELYKASEIVVYPDHETDLDKLNLWLKSLLEQELLSGSIQSCQLSAQVKHALEYPFYAILERMATRNNIEHYNFDSTRILKTSYCWPNICHEDLLSLAVEDFNRCQVIHGEEMREFERWFVENRLDELDQARAKSIYCYFTAAATMFAPELADARMVLTKHSLMAAVMDDLFDITGSQEEIKNIIQLVELWDVDVSTECCSDKVRIICSALRNTICETEEKGSKLQGRSIKHHLIAIWLDCVHAHMKEAEWRESKSVPTLDEYMSNGSVSISLGPCVLPALYLVGPKISEEMVSHDEYNNLFKAMSISARLLNDIRTFEREMEEGKLNTVSVLIINDGGESEMTTEAAILEMQRWINTERRELHRLVLEDSCDSVIPKPCKELFWNMSEICHLFYSKDDGFWSQGLMQAVNQVVHHPIILNHQIQM